MTKPVRRRAVNVAAPLAQRRCLYCLGADGPFASQEHIIPRSLGPDADRYVLPPGVVCDPCNTFLGQQVDAPFVDRFDMRLTRRLEDLRGRRGELPETIEGRDVTVRLNVDLDGATAVLLAARADETEHGGLDIEIRPLERDPADIVARTIRALWKIALGAAYLAHGREALEPRWDHLRHAVLGGPFKGCLLQRPFLVMVTRRLDVRVNLDEPENPRAANFELGGVALAAPLAEGATLRGADARRGGWDVCTTEDKQPEAVLLRLDPS